MYLETVKNRLTALRLEAGYTQEKLSELTGISRAKIAKIEVGILRPDIETIGKLAEFHGVSIDWLFGLAHKNKTSA